MQILCIRLYISLRTELSHPTKIHINTPT